ncbi:MAG: hypothetical protein C4558_02870 [Dehalococcoidia bacterium]|nr:MAG: hypothetical protein C4558_02870 [Dehalococcoidia bacterium]
MAHNGSPGIDNFKFFQSIDPWTALQDGRRQLIDALDACDPRLAMQMLTIPEFANWGDSTGPLSALLLAHAERDRAHAAFFASLNAGDTTRTSTPSTGVIAGDWAAVRSEIDAARFAMLEAAANLSPECWERPLFPPWEGIVEEYLPSLLIVRAMCDGILAGAIAALTPAVPVPSPARQGHAR